MNFHVLDQAEDGNSINVVFHFAVPATNNQAGISYQTALAMHLGGAGNITSAVASPEELTNMQAGSVYELSTNVRFYKHGLTPAQKLNEIKAAWTAKQAEMSNYFSIVLAFEGYSGNVT